MNTLHDLRHTLTDRAEALHDTERFARPVAVRERIRVARRRRAAAAASVAVVAVVAAVAVAGPLLRGSSSVEPAGRVAGVDVPEQVDVYGFPYRLADTREAGAGRARLDDSSGDRAVTLAASGLGGGSATMYVDDQAVARVFADSEVAAPYPIGTGAPVVRVVLDGTPDGARAGLAVYDATGGLAAGVPDSTGTATFRDELAGNPLLAAGFSDPDHASVELHARGSMDALRLAFYCSATDQHLWVQTTIDDEPGYGASCGGGGPDAAQGTSTTTDDPAPVRMHTFRVTLRKGSHGPRVDAGDVVFGLGVYGRQATADRVLGTRVDRTTEWGGRTWVLDRVLASPAVIDTSGGPDRLVGLVARGRASAAWRGLHSHGGTGTMAGGQGASTILGGLLLAGDRYEVTARGAATRLLVYRPE